MSQGYVHPNTGGDTSAGTHAEDLGQDELDHDVTIQVRDQREQDQSPQDRQITGEGVQSDLHTESVVCHTTNAEQTDPADELRRRKQQALVDDNSELHHRCFRVEEAVGAGNFGMVFRITLKRSGARVALKVVMIRNTSTVETIQTDIKGFQVSVKQSGEEFQNIQRLRHPNVVLGIGVFYGRFPGLVVGDKTYGPFFCLMIFSELAAGSLKQAMTKTTRGLINTEGGKSVLRRYLYEISDALSFMHGKGVVHHDIKPDNILISQDDHIRITDFGISAAASNSDAIISGDLRYVPPETDMDRASVAGVDASKKDVYMTGLSIYEVMRAVGGEAAASYRSNVWCEFVPEDSVGSPAYMWAVSDEIREEVVRRELSHIEGSEAVRLVSAMMQREWQQRMPMNDVKTLLLRFQDDPESFFANSLPPTNDRAMPTLTPHTVPEHAVHFAEVSLADTVCQWTIRIVPCLGLFVFVVVAFSLGSRDEDSKKNQNEYQNMVGATTAGFVFSTAVAGLVSLTLTRVHHNLGLRFVLIILVIVGTIGFGAFLTREGVTAVGAFFIVYGVSQLFTIWHVLMQQSEFRDLQKSAEEQVKYCNQALLDNLTRHELAGLLAPTLLFQLAILYAGISVVKSLPKNAGEVAALGVICWVVNLPRYFAHFSLVRAMTDAVNHCNKVSYLETLRQTFWSVNRILAWSLLAIQQPVWSVLEMTARTLIKAAHILIVCGAGAGVAAAAADSVNSDDSDGNVCSCMCGLAACAMATVGACTLPVAIGLKRCSFCLSVYCSKFYITLIAYDTKFGGDDMPVMSRLQLYGATSEYDVEDLMYLANKGIAAANSANFCILLGCCSAMIASTIDLQAAVYGYLAGYLAASTVLEVHSSMYLWFLAVTASGDDVCPAAMGLLRDSLNRIHADARSAEGDQAAQPDEEAAGAHRQGYVESDTVFPETANTMQQDQPGSQGAAEGYADDASAAAGVGAPGPGVNVRLAEAEAEAEAAAGSNVEHRVPDAAEVQRDDNGYVPPSL